MVKFFAKLKKSTSERVETSFFGNIGKMLLLLVALLLLIQVLIFPSVWIAIALLGLFLSALLS